MHCLSSSGQRDPRELTTAEAKQVLDELRDRQVFYINIGGGEPMVRRDFFELVDYSVAAGVGVLESMDRHATGDVRRADRADGRQRRLAVQEPDDDRESRRAAGRAGRPDGQLGRPEFKRRGET